MEPPRQELILSQRVIKSLKIQGKSHLESQNRGKKGRENKFKKKERKENGSVLTDVVDAEALLSNFILRIFLTCSEATL